MSEVVSQVRIGGDHACPAVAARAATLCGVLRGARSVARRPGVDLPQAHRNGATRPCDGPVGRGVKDVERRAGGVGRFGARQCCNQLH